MCVPGAERCNAAKQPSPHCATRCALCRGCTTCHIGLCEKSLVSTSFSVAVSRLRLRLARFLGRTDPKHAPAGAVCHQSPNPAPAVVSSASVLQPLLGEDRIPPVSQCPGCSELESRSSFASGGRELGCRGCRGWRPCSTGGTPSCSQAANLRSRGDLIHTHTDRARRRGGGGRAFPKPRAERERERERGREG